MVITGIENQANLDQAFEAVEDLQADGQGRGRRTAVAQRAPTRTAGKYELFKTSATFDGTAKNNAWLGDDVEGVQKLAPVME